MAKQYPWREVFAELEELLSEHSAILYQEALNHFPQSLQAYPPAWLEEISGLDQYHQFLLETGLGREQDYSFLKNSSLRNLLCNLQRLTTFEVFEKEQELHPNQYRKVSQKKLHELGRLIKFFEIQGLFQQNLLDLCGGKGHFSRLFLEYSNQCARVLDWDQALMDAGNAYLAKMPSFSCYNLLEEAWKKEIQPDACLFGLHPCGPLSLAQMEAFIHSDSKTLLNIPCCYHRLEGKDGRALQGRLSFQPYFGKLASMGLSCLSLEEYSFRLTKKTYRYTLGLFLFEHFQEYVSLGEERPHIYRRSLIDFCHFKLEKNFPDLPRDPLASYIHQKEVQKEVNLLISANLLRNCFARACEVYINLDRLLYLRDQGLTAQLLEIFDPRISPRNLLLLAKR